jgi:hypothetical protein
MSPAMAAGIADHLWEIGRIVNLIEPIEKAARVPLWILWIS